jgi:hypothetical protein
MPSLADFDRDTLAAWLAGSGHRPVHAKRLLRAFYDGCGEIDLDALPVGTVLRERLRTDWTPRSSVAESRVAADGTT